MKTEPEEYPEIDYYPPWQPKRFIWATTYYGLNYERRKVIAWCRVIFRSQVFFVTESMQEDFDAYGTQWVMTCAASGCAVHTTTNEKPGVCLEEGLRKLENFWPKYIKARNENINLIRSAVQPGVLHLLL